MKKFALLGLCLLLPLVVHAQAGSTGGMASVLTTGNLASLRFTPPANDTTLQEFANGLGNTPEDRQAMLEAIQTAKAGLFEQLYGVRGWKNNVAGAYAFLVLGLEYVRTGEETDRAVEDALFTRLGQTLAADLAGASDRDKSALYETLIANASLPLLLYIDGREKNDAAQIQQARALAAETGRKLLKMEPAEIAALVQPSASRAPATSGAIASSAPSVAAAAASSGGIDGRYECMMSQTVYSGGNYTIQYQPTGHWFQIRGSRYTTNGAGGAVQVSGDVVAFSGGGYDGWRGSLATDAINFREDTSDPRPGDPASIGDLRCGLVSG